MIRRILNGDQALKLTLADDVIWLVQDCLRTERDLLDRIGLAVESEGLRSFARRARLHAGHLSEVLNGKRRVSPTFQNRAKIALLIPAAGGARGNGARAGGGESEPRSD